MNSDFETLPELKEILGSLLLASKEPLNIKKIKKILVDTGIILKGPFEQYSKVDEENISLAIDELQKDLEKNKLGMELMQVAGGWRIQNKVMCGPFIRSLLDKNQTIKLSKPALETLAIVAYRKPCLRSEIEDVRGVSVDAVLRKLIEMQLLRVVRRSELPGRPWLFGTTQKFLEHFGINTIDELPGSKELKRVMSKKTKITSTMPEVEAELQDCPSVEEQ